VIAVLTVFCASWRVPPFFIRFSTCRLHCLTHALRLPLTIRLQSVCTAFHVLISYVVKTTLVQVSNPTLSANYHRINYLQLISRGAGPTTSDVGKTGHFGDHRLRANQSSHWSFGHALGRGGASGQDVLRSKIYVSLIRVDMTRDGIFGRRSHQGSTGRVRGDSDWFPSKSGFNSQCQT